MGVIDGNTLDTAQIVAFCVFSCLGLGFVAYIVAWVIDMAKGVLGL